MAFTRSMYDDCEYKKVLTEDGGVLSYNLDANKHFNCDQKRIDFGILAGNSVSQIVDENLVDIESDLRNQTRLYSRCPTRKFRPNCDVSKCGNANGYPCGDKSCGVKMTNLKETSMIDYRPRFSNIGYNLEGLGCPGNPTSFHTDPSSFLNRNDAFMYAQAPNSPTGYSQVNFMKDVAK